jgi:hypothetical protein
MRMRFVEEPGTPTVPAGAGVRLVCAPRNGMPLPLGWSVMTLSSIWAFVRLAQ